MTFNVVLDVTTSHMDYEYLENVKYQYTEKNLNILTCIFHVGKFYVKLLDYGIFVTYNMYMTIDKHTGNYNLQFTDITLLSSLYKIQFAIYMYSIR